MQLQYLYRQSMFQLQDLWWQILFLRRIQEL